MSDFLSFASLILCFVTILLSLRCFGYVGLYVLLCVITICTNIQVLKVTEYAMWREPLAMGTVIFSSTFAIDGILSEYYSATIARRGVWISFIAYLFFALQMMLCIAHPAVSNCNASYAQAIELLFQPSIALFFSSLVSFLCGQLCDVSIYSFIKQRNIVPSVWLRALISMSIANFIDNALFSVMAWKVFCVQEVSWDMLWHTYICGTYVFRLVIALLCVPIVRIAGFFVNRVG